MKNCSKQNYFDVIVIGGGHAGIEAACASARMGCNTALLTLNKNKIGHMPCNPAVGGIGKGHIVFEISALGGVMPLLCSKSYLQANMLNCSKGPAVQGLRLQIDKIKYAEEALKFVENQKNLTILEKEGDEILIESNKIKGIKTKNNEIYYCDSLILTTGTFLNGLVHMGLKNFSSGRSEEPAVTGLPKSIKNLGLKMGRLKTGTPPRLERTSVDFSVMEEQKSHNLKNLFEFDEIEFKHKISCFITRTNKNTHDEIKNNAHLSPIYRGDIKGIAPRYCPSIEDKIKRFEGKDSHQIFVEPESEYLNEVYPNGLSTSLPIEVQEKFIKTIKGFENAKISKAGYAIEYDFIFPNQLKHTLESNDYENLFFAGQINGTTGYEEAAGQGIIAGINAASKKLNFEKFILNREESYIGIMIDDLVTMGVDEPYRMFTSRAERRLSIRQDNVFYRLYEKAYQYKLIEKNLFEKIKNEYFFVKEYLEKIVSNKKLILSFSQKLSDGDSDFVKNYIIENSPRELNSREKEFIFAEILYYPYRDRENKEIEKIKEFRELEIPETFDYKNIPGLSKELQYKLFLYKPKTLAQASLIYGMTPAAISLLIFKIKDFKYKNK